MVNLFLLLCVLSALVFNTQGLYSIEEKEIDVITNPYDEKEYIPCKPQLETLIEPRDLIVQPMKTQADTFLELTEAKVLSVSIPVYKMKQPKRLSEAEFEFQMVLVKKLNKYGSAVVAEVPVEMERAKDSWFPGYFWTPIVMQCGEGGYRHVGWKFDSLSDKSTVGQSHFYALLVEVNKKERTSGIYVGGFKAPGWMAAGVASR